MANRYPLVVDTADGNKIKELPSGDNLNLSGSNIVNVVNVTATGTITATSVSVGGESIQPVAFSGSFNDLTDVPAGFSGSWNDLTNKPAIPTTTRQLTDVLDIEPENDQVLIYNSVSGKFEPGDLVSAFTLTNRYINELKDVVATGTYDNKFLKYYSGAWRPAYVTYAEIQNKPTNLSEFTNDVGFITSETDSQTLSFDGSTLTISGGNSISLNNITGDLKGSVFADDSTLLVDAQNSIFYGSFDGDLTGSVFADNSTLLVDAVNGTIPGYVSIEDLKTALQDGAGDYAAFKAWVLANL